MTSRAVADATLSLSNMSLPHDLLAHHPLAEDHHTQTAQFFQFTQWFRGAAFTFGVAAAVAALVWTDPMMGVTAGAVLAFAAWVTLARHWARRGLRHRAVMTVCFGLVSCSLIILAAQPVMFPTLLVASILPVTLSLQYARPAAKRPCIIVATLLLVAITLGGKFHAMPIVVPGWFITFYQVASVAVVGGVFLLLITQASTRLFDRLDEVERAKRATEEAKQALAVEHGQLLAVLDSQQDCVVAADRLGRVTMMNPAAEALTGWSIEEARTRHVADVVMLETDRESTEELWERVLEEGKPFLQTEGVALISRLGRRLSVAATAAPIRSAADPMGSGPSDPSGDSGALYGGVFTFRDMSQHLEIVARLRQTERFELIQGMAGIVGRDVRQAAAHGIRGASDDPQGRTPYRERRSRGAVAVAELSDADDVPFTVTESFLALGRQARVSPQAFNPTQLLYEVTQSLPRMLGKHCIVIAKPGKGVGKAYADFDRIRDVLLQLALAARRTMGTGGTVELTSVKEEVGEHYEGFVLGKLERGLYVRLDVRDSGCGYTREQLLRLFEPFQFSTHKDVDQSLRLAATYGTIRQNAGALLVESRPQIGSTFSVVLPAYDPTTMPRTDTAMGRI
jgi:PAS domain S-box-containing protein